MSPHLSRSQSVVLGCTVLIGLALAGYGVFALSNGQWPWSKPFHIQVGFASISGVSPGTRVRVKGHDAGEVEDVQLPVDPAGKVLLILRLDARFRDLVRGDARAQIVSEGVFGGKVIEVDPGSTSRDKVADMAEIDATPSMELAEVVGQLGNVIKIVDQQKARVGELVEDTDRLIRRGSDTMESMQQIAEGVKDMWGIRSYVKDPQKLLYPPGCECKPWWFAEGDLFEPGSDRLTSQGRQRLGDLLRDVSGLTRHQGSSVTVVAYARPAGDAGRSRRLTQNQSEVVTSFLKSQGAIHKDYGIWSHDITPLGMGEERPPVAEKEKIPPAGVGVLVFVPQR